MQIAEHFRAHLYRYGWVLLVIVAGYAAFQAAAPGELEFVELSSPKGFRTLVVNGNSSAFNPLQGLPWDTGSSEPSRSTEQEAGSVCQMLLHDETSPVGGRRDGTVSVVEFFDYRCPYCKVLTEILSKLQADGLVHVIYKEWPILGEGSVLGARAALAAGKQGKYLEVHERLMQSRLIPTMGYVEHLSGQLDINQEQLMKDMFSEETTLTLRRNAALASKLGLTGTPVLVVGRTFVQGAVTQKQLERLIALERSAGPVCGRGG